MRGRLKGVIIGEKEREGNRKYNKINIVLWHATWTVLKKNKDNGGISSAG